MDDYRPLVRKADNFTLGGRIVDAWCAHTIGMDMGRCIYGAWPVRDT